MISARPLTSIKAATTSMLAERIGSENARTSDHHINEECDRLNRLVEEAARYRGWKPSNLS
jgi:hypothetical protein